MTVNIEFLDTLLRSPTFWREAVTPAAIATILLLLIYLMMRLARQKKRIRRIHTDILGAAAAVDFILTIPIVFAVVFMIVQFALLSHASLVVHYAAYASARSARVWYWDYDTAFIDGIVVTAGVNPAAIKNQFVQRVLANNDAAAIKAELAAGYALIAIAPAFYPAGAASNTTKSTSVQRLITEIAKLTNDRTRAPWTNRPVDRPSIIGRKASYAFSPRNTTVDVHPVNPEFPDSIVDVADATSTTLELFSAGIAWQVQADVQFRYYMSVPFAARIFGDRQPEGFYARVLSAEVRLL